MHCQSLDYMDRGRCVSVIPRFESLNVRSILFVFYIACWRLLKVKETFFWSRFVFWTRFYCVYIISYNLLKFASISRSYKHKKLNINRIPSSHQIFTHNTSYSWTSIFEFSNHPHISIFHNIHTPPTTYLPETPRTLQVRSSAAIVPGALLPSVVFIIRRAFRTTMAPLIIPAPSSVVSGDPTLWRFA